MMKKTILTSCALLFSVFLFSSSFSFLEAVVSPRQQVHAIVSVRGHVRSNGTYVAPYYRSSPNSTTLDNWSTRGNVNPFTGSLGTQSLETYSTPSYFYTPSYSLNNLPFNPTKRAQILYVRNGKRDESNPNKIICNSGFRLYSNKECLNPEGIISRGNGWRCKNGYEKTIDGCSAIAKAERKTYIPAFKYVEKIRDREKNIDLGVPKNSIKTKNGWECLEGYQKSLRSNDCLPLYQRQ